jgi:hypothetical protein
MRLHKLPSHRQSANKRGRRVWIPTVERRAEVVPSHHLDASTKSRHRPLDTLTQAWVRPSIPTQGTLRVLASAHITEYRSLRCLCC